MASLICKVGGSARRLAAAKICGVALPFPMAIPWHLGELDLLYKLSAAGRSSAHVCRNLHRLIHREGFTVPVEISFVETPVRKRRPIVKKVTVAYPVIYPSSWINYLLREQSYLLLGGVELCDVRQWQALLSDFWRLYRMYDPDHIMNFPNAPASTHTIPLYLHGDEGRGKYKLPIMVESFQPCISFKGIGFKNSSGPPACNRYMFIVSFGPDNLAGTICMYAYIT